MVYDPDIWRAANRKSATRSRNGSNAVDFPAADELLAAGDVEGCAVWKRILAAVAELTRTTPAEGELVN